MYGTKDLEIGSFETTLGRFGALPGTSELWSLKDSSEVAPHTAFPRGLSGSQALRLLLT